jgi:DNA polymerase I-like protein with 3'-5' exonuclease and polymerase domains
MSNIKQAFVSRFGEDGMIVEADWSQLEIYVLQIVSGDPELRDELNSGVDLHTMMTSQLFKSTYLDVSLKIRDHDPVWTARRRNTKRARFALQYGASAQRISDLTGWSLAESKYFIKTYYEKYAKIAQYHKRVKEEVLSSAKPIGYDSAVGTKYKGQFTSPNGRRYVFDGVDKGDGAGVRFSGTQLKNYPIQGLASDFVKKAASNLHMTIKRANLDKDVLLVNTVHDSVIIDTNKTEEEIHKVIRSAYGAAQAVWLHMCPTCPADVTFKYEVTTGKHWSK